MNPKWLKLASLAQIICTLSSLVRSLLPMNNLLTTTISGRKVQYFIP